MDARKKQLVIDTLLIHQDEVEQGHALKVRDIFKEAAGLIQRPYVTQDQLGASVVQAENFLPGFDKRERYKLCAALFKAAGLEVEGWE